MLVSNHAEYSLPLICV